MKGIRKLFLGLFLVALFGVGFKVDAKAATNVSLDLKVLDGTTDSDFSNANAKLVGKFIIEDTGCFPNNTSGTASYIYTCVLKDTQNAKEKSENTKIVTLTTTVDETLTKYKVLIGDEVKYEGTSDGDTVTPTLTSEYELFSISRDTVRGYITTDSTSTDGTKSAKYYLTATGVKNPTDSTATEPGTVSDVPATGLELKLGRVSAAAYLGDATSPFGTVSPSEKYLFANEQATFTSSISTYSYIKWTNDYGTLGTHSKGSCVLTMANAPTAIILKEVYGNITIDDTISGKAGETTTAVSYTNHGYTLPGDIEKVTFRGNTLATTTTTWTSGKFTFAIPDGTPEGTYPLSVTMSDAVGGGTYSFEVTVDNGAKPDIASDVYVTEGMKIALSKYQESGESTKSVMARINSETSSYASIDPSSARTTPKSISSVYLVGVSSTTKKTGGLTVYNATGTESDTANVTVYPQPSIDLNSSSSGTSLNSGTTSSSSADSPFKVTLPTGVYHDSIIWSNVSKAKIVFSYDGKTKEAELDMGSTSGSTSLSKTSSVDSLVVSDIIDDLVGDSDHYSIRITAYPMNGSTVDTAVYDSKTVDVYRVSLDGSAGARYYVNGSEKSGHFYAVKGTTYTIKSSAKNSGDRFQNWDDSVFSSESGGSYKVLGARTFKANYNNGSSSSSSSSSSSRNAATAGEGMDDYDDVPKTGESKADIWILWSVLFVSILGAGFMIWKRFGLVRAIAEADEEVAVAEHKEEVKAKKKEKEDKIKMLKDLRNL